MSLLLRGKVIERNPTRFGRRNLFGLLFLGQSAGDCAFLRNRIEENLAQVLWQLVQPAGIGEMDLEPLGIVKLGVIFSHIELAADIADDGSMIKASNDSGL